MDMMDPNMKSKEASNCWNAFKALVLGSCSDLKQLVDKLVVIDTLIRQLGEFCYQLLCR